MKTKVISKERKVRASSARQKRAMSDAQVLAEMQRQLKRNHKTLDALAKL